MHLPASAERVARSTARHVNDRIRREADERIDYYMRHQDEIPERLRELDHEWDIERALEANASTLTLVGIGLGAFLDRRFLILPAVVSGFLLQHALQGWCPPLPILRRRGLRTPREIERERARLMALRGDFDRLRERVRTTFTPQTQGSVGSQPARQP